MNPSRRVPRTGQPALLTPAQAFNRLVSANAFGAAQELLKDLDRQELDHCIEEIGALMHDQGIELPDWERLSEQELRKIALGAFYLKDGQLVLLTEA